MDRLHAIGIGLLLAACQQQQKPESKPKHEPVTPDFPERVLVGSDDCRYCAESDLHGCGILFRYECPHGGTCGQSVPCDVVCCSTARAALLGLDQQPWGPILADAVKDERPPTGLLAYHRGADLFVARPSRIMPTKLLRLSKPIDAWRWSEAQREIVFAAGGQLQRFDVATRVFTASDDSDELGSEDRWKHPSGEFLAIWRHEDGKRCVLEFVAPDQVRRAQTAIEAVGPTCPPIAFSPDGRHLALGTQVPVVVGIAAASGPAISVGPDDGIPILWLDDTAADSLATVAGFIAACEQCGDPLEPRSPIAGIPLAEMRIAPVVALYGDQPRPGGLLAYVDLVDGRSREIHVVAPKGGRARVLTDAPEGAEGPVWSDDGGLLAVVTDVGRGIAIIDLETRRVSEPALHQELALGSPDFLADGTMVVAGRERDRPMLPAKLWIWSGVHEERATSFPASLGARPSRGPGGLLLHADLHGFDRLVRGEVEAATIGELGHQLPRMIAPRWHPSFRFFAAWVGIAGDYELAWVDAVADQWTGTGIRYGAAGKAHTVAEPSAIAFAPDGTHFAFVRPDPERGGMTIEVAAIDDPQSAKIVARSSADVGDVSWSVPAAAEQVARAKLPYEWGSR